MRATNTAPKGQINAPDQLDCMSTLRTDNSATLVNALAEIEKLKGLLATDSTSTLNDAMHEIECLRKANLDCVAHYDDARAECERHIQEVDASREAIERQSAALRVALEALEETVNVPCYGGHPKQEAAITIIKEAL